MTVMGARREEGATALIVHPGDFAQRLAPTGW